MNKRIQLLAVEADFMLCEDGHFYSEGQSQKITDQLQKFAQLIVRECADVCDLYGMPDGTSETAIILSAAIKRKFGVE